MNRIKVYLIKRSRTLPSGKRSRNWLLRWHDSTGKPWSESAGPCDSVTAADAKAKRAAKEDDLNGGRAPVSKPGKMTLAELEAAYMRARSQGEQGRGFRKASRRLDERTLARTSVTFRYMAARFGADCDIASITPDAAESFLDDLHAGKLIDANKHKGGRRRPPGASSVRLHIRIAKGIFAWAARSGFVSGNPFDGFDGRQTQSPTPYIDVATVERVIAAAPDARWRVLFGLCRYAGLRIGEAIGLPWTGEAADRDGVKHAIGIDWKRRRISLVAEKTGKHRIVPVPPRLHELLTEAAKLPGSLVCGLTMNTAHTGKRIITAAGVKPWRKTYQACRKSCEDDWKAAGVALDTYAKWMGHSAAVSSTHYTTPNDQEFEQVTRLRLVG